MPWDDFLRVQLAAISGAYCKPEWNILPPTLVYVVYKRYIPQVLCHFAVKNDRYCVWRSPVFYSAKRRDNLVLHDLLFLPSSAAIPKGLTHCSNTRHSSLQKQNQTSYMGIIKCPQSILNRCKAWLTVLCWNPVEFKELTSYRHLSSDTTFFSNSINKNY